MTNSINKRKPFFGIVSFQTDRKRNQLTNASVFDNCNTKDISLEIDSQIYPQEKLNMDFNKNIFAEIYDRLCDLKKIFFRTSGEVPLMYLDPDNFKNHETIFSIDMTRQPVSISERKSSIILNIEFEKDVPKKTLCYVCLVSNKEFLYDIVNHNMTEIVSNNV